ncbi:MAG TPA: ABC transporter permease [Acidimicrobiales bacterium]|nr:ABC transporter permease [Acidimicrobiales bacterium]
MKAFWAQASAETRLTLRRGESLLLTLGIPIGLLIFLATTKVLSRPSDQVSFLAPGLLALAIMSTGMVSLGISTAFDREHKVLKRLGTTPLGRPRLVGAKVVSVLMVELLQVVLIAVAGVAIGWRPGAGGTAAVSAVGAAFLATVAFSGLGLVMAGRLPADVVLATANALWLAFLLLGGMILPLSKLPRGLRALADGLPSSALAAALHTTLGNGQVVPGRDWLVLCIWAIAAPSLAAFSFRWE